MALTQESLLSFLLEQGGKVKNSDLLNHFRSLVSCCDPAEKQHNRELFKKLVNSVAVVKLINDVKFVVVKKRYQDFAKEAENVPQQKWQMDESFSSRVSYTSPRRTDRKETPSGQNNSDGGMGLLKKRPLSSGDLTAVKILNIPADQTGAVFAVVAVKSPPRSSAPAAQDALLSQKEKADKTNIKVVQTCQKDSSKESLCSTKQKAMQTQSSSLRSNNNNKTQKHPDDAKYTESVPLEPLAHQWLVKCAAGQWGQIYTLLLQDIHLVQRKDFTSGFTALHWAAKDGNQDMIKKLMDISRKKGVYVNVNCKSHGGYTPLHIAAMHGHAEVLAMLVQRYRADTNERDNDGKKAVRYLEKSASQEIKELLGGLHGKEKIEEEEKEQTKGFNSISKLFQPHIGKKHKTTMKFAHEW